MSKKRPLAAIAVVAALAGSMLTTTAASAADSTAPDSGYTSTDKGDGTYTVPVINADVPDVSVAMVPAAENAEGRDIYYMVSTTMHLSPGAPIMKSYDGVNWETVNYVFNRISISDASSLRNGKESYGQGQWASSLRYHDGTFYVLFNTNNLGGAYLYTTKDIENGVWESHAFGRAFHDPSLFFDDANGGTPYIFYGSGGTSAVKLSEDLSSIVAEYPNIFRASDYADQSFVGGLFEGAQVYKIGDYYYVFIITWPSGQGRQEAVFRSKDLLGRYQSVGGANTYEARSALNSNGFAQGGLFEVPRAGQESDWYGFFFRDTFPVGRIPALIPATWKDGWPTFGNNGNVPYNGTFDKVISLTPAQTELERSRSVVASDDFDNDAPHRAWSDEKWQIPAQPAIDQSLLGVELFANANLDAGTTGWIVNDNATLTASPNGHNGSSAVLISDRKTTGSGIAQDVSGKVQHDVTYDISAWVKYDKATSPATKQFILTARYGNGTYTNLANVTATNGQWAQIKGSFTVPSSQPLDSMRIFLETPWTSATNVQASPDAHVMDVLVDDLSLRGRPLTTEAPSADEIAYNGSDLDPAWEWNHAPDNRYWSLTERPGWLSLTNGKVVTGQYKYAKLSGKDDLTWFEEARNTLSQRTFGPKQSVETTIDVSRMKDGDVAGLATYTRSFAYAGVKKVDGQYTLGIVYRGQPFQATLDRAATEAFVSGSTVPLGDSRVVHLKADVDSVTNGGQMWIRYYYSLDGQTWQQLGQRTGPLSMDWSLSHFMGYRMGLFSYATQQTGGGVDFDHYSLSKVLTADGVAVTGARLDAAISRAAGLKESDYPAAAWASFQHTYGKAIAARDAAAQHPFSTLNQVEAVARPLERSLAELAVIAESTPPALTVTATTTSRCVAGKSVLAVTVKNASDVPVTAAVSTPVGNRTVSVAAGAASSVALSTRQVSVPAGVASVEASGEVGGKAVKTTVTAPYEAHTCGR
ncbi:family 43 glycosylhydrolase [Microbacterium dextranolyticum]|uniref:Endo-1,4-beta-xylanase n=1 Tax=Microbacterium dextranolyticum TaxID=36806 RepID=A0A9W6M7G1_9MICO|nr:family 43 glycosylhydrolase [Microbacterium dextranolyticum]MBM7464055.1 beta-xylosidase [Microbacterium dextranolyticum]GLJ96615.1 endo-1,4-beta-xylanase [Microbacterium dextranolyticum]